MTTTPPDLQPPSLVSALVLSVVRHGLTAVGGLILAKGIATPDQVNAISTDLIGVAAILVAMAWSALTHNATTKTTAGLIQTVNNLAGGS